MFKKNVLTKFLAIGTILLFASANNVFALAPRTDAPAIQQAAKNPEETKISDEQFDAVHKVESVTDKVFALTSLVERVNKLSTQSKIQAITRLSQELEPQGSKLLDVQKEAIANIARTIPIAERAPIIPIISSLGVVLSQCPIAVAEDHRATKLEGQVNIVDHALQKVYAEINVAADGSIKIDTSNLPLLVQEEWKATENLLNNRINSNPQIKAMMAAIVTKEPYSSGKIKINISDAAKGTWGLAENRPKQAAMDLHGAILGKVVAPDGTSISMVDLRTMVILWELMRKGFVAEDGEGFETNEAIVEASSTRENPILTSDGKKYLRLQQLLWNAFANDKGVINPAILQQLQLLEQQKVLVDGPDANGISMTASLMLKQVKVCDPGAAAQVNAGVIANLAAISCA